MRLNVVSTYSYTLVARALRERELPGQVHVDVLRAHELRAEQAPRGLDERLVVEQRRRALHRAALRRPVPAEDGRHRHRRAARLSGEGRVLGAVRGLALVESHGAAALVVQRTGASTTVLATSGFPALADRRLPPR